MSTRDDWQAIETAPPDQEILLGWWRDWPTREWRQEVDLAHSTRGGWFHGQATHWQPLPAPPGVPMNPRDISAAKGNHMCAAQLEHDELVAQIKAFGDSRVNAAVREMHRQYELTLYHDDGLEVILDRCKANIEVEERINAANRKLVTA